jgi:hypothetical protein
LPEIVAIALAQIRLFILRVSGEREQRNIGAVIEVNYPRLSVSDPNSSSPPSSYGFDTCPQNLGLSRGTKGAVQSEKILP